MFPRFEKLRIRKILTYCLKYTHIRKINYIQGYFDSTTFKSIALNKKTCSGKLHCKTNFLDARTWMDYIILNSAVRNDDASGEGVPGNFPGTPWSEGPPGLFIYSRGGRDRWANGHCNGPLGVFLTNNLGPNLLLLIKTK